jgi:bacillithiol biosynthesis cysteine-adding enzyme BshC
MPADANAAAMLQESAALSGAPWVRPLVTAFTTQYPSVASLFAGNPADPRAWKETIARVQQSPRNRAALAAALTRQLEQRNAPASAREAAASLARPDTVAVVTGQQAGAFGGPLYSLLKAVTALQLAKRVREEHGTPAVTVFWVDAEDHDWEEVRTAHVLDRDFSLVDVAIDPPPGAGDRSVGALQLTEGVATAIDALERTLPPTEFTAEVITALRARYRAGETMAQAFAGWIDDLLGQHGLITFDASDASVKPLVAEVFRCELDHPSMTAKLAREAGDVMARLGHEPQVQPAEDGVALFYMDGAGRRPVKRRNGEYVIGDTRRSPAELAGEATANPERFSPNVLLRPLVQDRLFPTICYVAGPAELAYQAQLGQVYRAFELEAPLLYPRASVTLLDSAAAKFLERSHLPIESLAVQDDSVLNKLLEQHLPPDIERAVAEIERVVGTESARLRQAVGTVDPTLAGAVDTTADRVRDTLKHLHNKIVQASKRKDDTLRRQFARTRALTFPGGQPQQRVLNIAFFANRYGLTIADRLIDVLPLRTDRHYLVTL